MRQNRVSVACRDKERDGDWRRVSTLWLASPSVGPERRRHRVAEWDCTASQSGRWRDIVMVLWRRRSESSGTHAEIMRLQPAGHRTHRLVARPTGLGPVCAGTDGVMRVWRSSNERQPSPRRLPLWMQSARPGMRLYWHAPVRQSPPTDQNTAASHFSSRSTSPSLATRRGTLRTDLLTLTC